MTITKTQDKNEMTLQVEGRLDTNTAPQLEETVREMTDEVKVLIFDLKGLEYISSAGLRVLLTAQKMMNQRGKMIIRNACDDVMEVFDITGFIDILTIE